MLDQFFVIGVVTGLAMVSAVFWLCFVNALDRRPIRGYVARSHQSIRRVLGALCKPDDGK